MSMIDPSNGVEKDDTEDGSTVDVTPDGDIDAVTPIGDIGPQPGEPERAHVLRTDDHWFQALIDGRKTCEIRDSSDRDFQAGDLLALVEQEWDPNAETPYSNLPPGAYVPSGRVFVTQITHVVQLGLLIDDSIQYAALSLDREHRLFTTSIDAVEDGITSQTVPELD